MSSGVNSVQWNVPLSSTGSNNQTLPQPSQNNNNIINNSNTNANPISIPTPPNLQLRFPSHAYNLDWIRTIDAFEIVDVLGEGTFGQVLKGRDKASNELVALKKIKEESGTDGFPISALREINILKKLRDIKKTDNVVVLKEIITSRDSSNQSDKGSIFLIFEYMDHDLAGLMEMHYDLVFKQQVIKCYLQQLLKGIYDLHLNRILHRDIKASNLLVNNQGILKIADFGLARPLCQNVSAYTANVITLWYRPPELLMCDEKSKRLKYTTHVDIWSVGCVFAEMLFRKSLFRGRDSLELLDQIFSVLGTPTLETAPELLSLEDWQDFKPKVIHSPQLQNMCKEKNFPPHTYELLSGLLAYDPSKRLQAAQALDSDYFWRDPLPCLPSDIPACTASHEYTVKKKKEKIKSTSQLRPPQPLLHPPYLNSEHHRHPSIPLNSSHHQQQRQQRNQHYPPVASSSSYPVNSHRYPPAYNHQSNYHAHPSLAHPPHHQYQLLPQSSQHYNPHLHPRQSSAYPPYLSNDPHPLLYNRHLSGRNYPLEHSSMSSVSNSHQPQGPNNATASATHVKMMSKPLETTDISPITIISTPSMPTSDSVPVMTINSRSTSVHHGNRENGVSMNPPSNLTHSLQLPSTSGFGSHLSPSPHSLHHYLPPHNYQSSSNPYVAPNRANTSMTHSLLLATNPCVIPSIDDPKGIFSLNTSHFRPSINVVMTHNLAAEPLNSDSTHSAPSIIDDSFYNMLNIKSSSTNSVITYSTSFSESFSSDQPPSTSLYRVSSDQPIPISTPLKRLKSGENSPTEPITTTFATSTRD